MCDETHCRIAQHAECSAQGNMPSQTWRCDDCWLLSGGLPPPQGNGARADQPEAHSAGMTSGTGRQKHQGSAGQQGWLVGAQVINARGVEYTIKAMRHGYVQCRQGGGEEVHNYRRKELQLVGVASASGTGQSAASEAGGDSGDDASEVSELQHNESERDASDSEGSGDGGVTF